MSANARLTRVWTLAGILATWVLVIAGRLYYLQVVESANFREEAARQQQRSLDITPPRGVISDRTGKVLATTIKVDSVFAVPREIQDPGRVAAALARITKQSPGKLQEKLSSSSYFAWVQRKIDPSMRAEIERLKLPGIHFQEEDRRSYPGGQLAAQLLGYVNIDDNGLAGIEYRYDKVLRGEPGKVVMLVDARPRVFSRVEQEPTAGADLTLTVDEHIQFILERELQQAAATTKAAHISMVAQNPRTGEILGMANYPSFNPNDIQRSKPDSRINRAVSQVYEPGSTFKILTLGAAIEEKLTTPEELIDCLNGSIIIAKHKIRDHKPFGVLSVKEVMQYSSDVGAIKLGMRLGDDRLSSYIERLGFGRLTGVDLPGEERGLVRPPERWSKISIGAVSMGQEIGVTPLQILSMVSAVANGGILYRPYVVSKVEHPRDGVLVRNEPIGQRVLSEATTNDLQEMLEVVVTDGTAKASKPEGYRAAGKTGTAQKIDESGRYSTTKFVASFAGYAPVSNPSIALIVVVDEPRGAYHGGDVAAPIFKRVVEQVLRYRSVPPDVPEYAPRYTVAPDRATPPESIAPQAKDWSLVRASFGDAPAPEENPAGNVVVPDFQGKFLRPATEQALKLGITLRSKGSGRIVAQNPPAGVRVNAGATVEVLLSLTP
ncbi:MAG TPA: penicillin-binding protein [Terriglobia bacterium]|nr:penicillin-binding protein [Terriglobia bacterium]